MSLSSPSRPLLSPLNLRIPAQSLIYLFFFTSGIPALTYQLIWQRVLFRIFGVNMESVTVVITAFMLGLGLGSLFGSWLSTRRSLAPLLVVAAMEVVIGLFGLGSLKLFDLTEIFVQDLSLPAKAVVAVGLLLLPTALMGATLPLLVGHAVKWSANVGASTGSLYRANTLGAVAGCLGCALVLFPHLGLQGSIRVAASLNALVGGAALVAFLLQRTEQTETHIEEETPTVTSGRGKLTLLASLALAFIGGFVSLSYEIFFFHLGAFASATNSIVFAATLAAFLLGIASGAQLAADWCKDLPAEADLPAGLFKLLLFNGVLGLTILPVLSLVAPLGIGGLIGFLVLAAFVTARSLGVIFPLVAHSTIRPNRDSGRRVGLLYLANILGSAAGSMLTGFVLSDILGIRGLAVVLSILCFGIVAVLVSLSARQLKTLRLPVGAAMASATTLIILQGPLTASVIEAMLYKGQGEHLSQVIENRNGIIAASASGVVDGGGIYDGRFNIDLRNDTNGIIRPFGLSLYHANPREVLIIGLASGSWAQIIANHPDVLHLTIIEINPGYLRMIQEKPEIASLLKNDKVRIVIDDGRRWLNSHPNQKFDAIIANTTYHFRANAANLLSVEYNALIRAHLSQGGIYLYNATDSLRVERTGCESFRYGYRVLNNLLVSDAPFDLDTERWRKSLVAYRIDGRPVLQLERPEDAETLQTVLAMSTDANALPPKSAEQRMESCASILAHTAGMAPITDDNMGTEWRYPLGLD